MSTKEREYDISCNSYHGSDDINNFSVPLSPIGTHSRRSRSPHQKKSQTQSPYRISYGNKVNEVFQLKKPTQESKMYLESPSFGGVNPHLEILTSKLKITDFKHQNQTPLNSIKNSMAFPHENQLADTRNHHIPNIPVKNYNLNRDNYREKVRSPDHSLDDSALDSSYDNNELSIGIMAEESESDISNQRQYIDVNLKNM